MYAMSHRNWVLSVIFSKPGELKRVIIFSGKKDKVKDITRELQRIHINCAPMHSDLTQQERDDVMYRFKAGMVDVLVSLQILLHAVLILMTS